MVWCLALYRTVGEDRMHMLAIRAKSLGKARSDALPVGEYEPLTRIVRCGGGRRGGLRRKGSSWASRCSVRGRSTRR